MNTAQSLSADATNAPPLCLTPRKRRAIVIGIGVYMFIQLGMNSFFRMSSDGWTHWLKPPFAAWSLYSGGSAEQTALEITLTPPDGHGRQVNLDHYFAYRLPHRPGISLPERCEPLLVDTPNEHHAALLDKILREYGEAHPQTRPLRATAFLRVWDMDRQTRNQGERIHLLERTLP